jgi:hypothetical protein
VELHCADVVQVTQQREQAAPQLVVPHLHRGGGVTASRGAHGVEGTACKVGAGALCNITCCAW